MADRERTTEHVEVGAARLAVTDRGGSGPALIALHAGVADSRVWDRCVPRWVEDGWRVITYDRRGYGRSTWQPEEFSHLDDLFAVMDARGVDRAVLVGNSMGGRVASDAAATAPDRVAALVLIGPALTGAPYPYGDSAPEEEALDEAAEAAGERGDLEEANRLEAHLWLDGPLQPEGRVGGPARELFLDMNGIELAATDVGTERRLEAEAGAWARAADISMPTLVVIGGHDMTLVNAWSQGLAERLPDATLVELPGSAHLPSLDDPDGFLTATAPFLDRVRASLGITDRDG